MNRILVCLFAVLLVCNCGQTFAQLRASMKQMQNAFSYRWTTQDALSPAEYSYKVDSSRDLVAGFKDDRVLYVSRRGLGLLDWSELLQFVRSVTSVDGDGKSNVLSNWNYLTVSDAYPPVGKVEEDTRFIPTRVSGFEQTISSLVDRSTSRVLDVRAGQPKAIMSGYELKGVEVRSVSKHFLVCPELGAVASFEAYRDKNYSGFNNVTVWTGDGLFLATRSRALGNQPRSGSSPFSGSGVVDYREALEFVAGAKNIPAIRKKQHLISSLMLLDLEKSGHKTLQDAIADIGPDYAIDHLIKSLARQKPELRLRRAKKLGSFGTKKAITPLVSLIGDERFEDAAIRSVRQILTRTTGTSPPPVSKSRAEWARWWRQSSRKCKDLPADGVAPK